MTLPASPKWPWKITTTESVRETLNAHKNGLVRRANAADAIEGGVLRRVLRGQKCGNTEDLLSAVAVVLKHAPPDTPDSALLEILTPCAEEWQDLPALLTEARRAPTTTPSTCQGCTTLAAQYTALATENASLRTRLERIEEILRAAGADIPTTAEKAAEKVDGSGNTPED